MEEKKALIEATQPLKSNHQTSADIVSDFVAKNKKCKELKMLQKFTKQQLAEKVKKLFKH